MKKHFFVSYNGRDKQWAEWIAWILEEAGYSVIIQAWDFRPGSNFVLEMQNATVQAEKTIAVLSDNYLNAHYTHPELAAAFAQDPTGQTRTLIPIRVAKCEIKGLWQQIVYADVVNLSEAEAKEVVLGALQERAKPTQAPSFPGVSLPFAERITPQRVDYPGAELNPFQYGSPVSPSLLQYINACPDVFFHESQQPLIVLLDLQDLRFHKPSGIMEGLRHNIIKTDWYRTLVKI